MADVFPLWSSASLESKWVRDEAAYARDRNTLIPIRLDAVEPPLGFRQVQSLDFGRSMGEVGSEAFEMLVESLSRLVRDDRAVAPPPRPVVKPSARRAGRRRLLWSGAVVVAAVIAAIVWSSISRNGSTADGFESGRVLIDDFKLMTDDNEAARFANGLTDTIERVFTTVGIETIGHVGTNPTNAPVGAEFVVRGTIDSADGKLIADADIVHARDAAQSNWFQEQVAFELAGVLSFALACAPGHTQPGRSIALGSIRPRSSYECAG